MPRPLRDKAGKTTLIRSLKTTSHAVALRRYGAAYAALEQELQDLLKGPSVRQRVYLSGEDTSLKEDPTDQPLSPLEQTRLAISGSFNPDDPFHQHIFNYFNKGIELPITWDEAIDIWIEVRNRENTRTLAKGSIAKVKCNVADFQSYSQPLDIDFDVLDKFVSDQEKLVTPSTVKSKLKGISGILSALVSKRKLQHNVLKDYVYKVGKSSDKRAYTDREFKLVAAKHPACFYLAMTGMRASELQGGVIENNIMVVTEASDNEFRPKTLSSYRRVPLPPGFVRPTSAPRTWRTQLRTFITDKNVTPHSGRHFFIQTSRRAGCDRQVIAEICGHGSDVGSSSQRGYGEFPDEVLIREAQKVWDYVNNNILNNDPSSTRVSSVH